jgi:hypothetical protein
MRVVAPSPCSPCCHTDRRPLAPSKLTLSSRRSGWRSSSRLCSPPPSDVASCLCSLPLLRLRRACHTSELLHPPLLSSIHRGRSTLLPPSPFFLAQEHRKELGAVTSPLLCPPRHPSPMRASLPVPFSNPHHWRLHPTSLVVSPPDRKQGRSSYAGTTRIAGEPIAAPDAPSPHELPAVMWVPGECARRCSCST